MESYGNENQLIMKTDTTGIAAKFYKTFQQKNILLIFYIAKGMTIKFFAIHSFYILIIFLFLFSIFNKY